MLRFAETKFDQECVGSNPLTPASQSGFERISFLGMRKARQLRASYDHNPISTSYELLWQEVRSSDRSKITIQNTLRRILENYFKILGNLDKDKISEKFEGRDQQICGSLFSWINEGSHSFNDDLYISVDDAVIARYLDVFRRIFEVTGHKAHYEMMLGPEALAAMTAAPPAGEPLENAAA